VDSDHRALFIDVNIDIILGGRPPMFSSPALRGIDSTADDNCKTYISLLLKYLLDHNVFDRAERLKTWTTQHGLTERLKNQWEGLDREKHDCRLPQRRTPHVFSLFPVAAQSSVVTKITHSCIIGLKGRSQIYEAPIYCKPLYYKNFHKKAIETIG
jgi:hypothetical protein